MFIVSECLKYYHILEEVLDSCNLQSSDKRLKNNRQLAILLLHRHLLAAGGGLNGSFSKFKVGAAVILYVWCVVVVCGCMACLICIIDPAQLWSIWWNPRNLRRFDHGFDHFIHHTIYHVFGQVIYRIIYHLITMLFNMCVCIYMDVWTCMCDSYD